MKRFNKDKYLRKLKLKRYWQTNSRYFYIGISCLLCLVLGIYFAYSKFFVTGEEEVIRTTVGEFIYGDIIMTPYVDGQYSSTFPEKKTGINVEKVVCDNGVTASWDDDKWGLYATNLSKRTKCSVYFVTPASCGINDNVSCINSREGLANLANEVNNGDNKSGKIIYLTSDLDLGGKFNSDGNALEGNISWTPIGTESNPFSGTFDGNGHIISNMYVNEENYAALFGVTKNSKITNLGIENSYVKSLNNTAAGINSYGVNARIANVYSLTTVNGQKNTAGIIGIVTGSVINSYNGGLIYSNNTQFGAGIVGYVSGSYSSVSSCYNYGNIYGMLQSAGIVGGLQGTVLQSYNLGGILPSDGAEKNIGGGIVGQLYNPTIPKVYNSYNSGMVNGGGIIGSDYDSNGNDYILLGNYYLETSALYGINYLKSNIGAEPLPADEMPSVISVINGDNAFVEDTNNINNGYPILKWQAERENN